MRSIQAVEKLDYQIDTCKVEYSSYYIFGLAYFRQIQVSDTYGCNTFQQWGLDPNLLDEPTTIIGKLRCFCDLQPMGLLRTKFGK